MPNKNFINCIIVDDEPSSQQVIAHFISSTAHLQLQKICNNAAEAFTYLQTASDIDLIFLDINMPNQSGLDFYKSLPKPPKVIFTTAYPQYAVEGFEVNAIDYLLKPIAYERFVKAISKVTNQMNGQDIVSDFLVLKENKVLHKIQVRDIRYVEAFGDYVKVHTDEKTIVTHSTFKNMLGQLPEYFIRIHKSFSVNIHFITQLSGNLITVDSYKIPIGQTYKATVLEKLKFNA